MGRTIKIALVGAGLGSAIVQTAMFLGLLAFVLLDRQFRRYYLLARFWRADWPRMAAPAAPRAHAPPPATPETS